MKAKLLKKCTESFKIYSDGKGSSLVYEVNDYIGHGSLMPESFKTLEEAKALRRKNILRMARHLAANSDNYRVYRHKNIKL